VAETVAPAGTSAIEAVGPIDRPGGSADVMTAGQLIILDHVVTPLSVAAVTLLRLVPHMDLTGFDELAAAFLIRSTAGA
jgi:hypothetical protein